MGNVLAIDGSTKSTGWATMVDGKLEYGCITSASNDPEKRIIIMRDGILEVIRKYNIDTVIMEEVRAERTNNRTVQLLHWLQGSVKIAVFEYNKKIKFDFIGASSWRSKIGIQGYRVKREEQKKKDIEYAETTYDVALDNNDDIADAICILSAYGKEAAPATDEYGFEFK